MTNSADQLIYRAAQLLDENGNAEEAMVVLREAIALAEVAQHHLELLRGHMFLGELLFDLERLDEAKSELQKVLTVSAQFADQPELVDEEVATAKDLLAQLSADA